jgi:hypothetical protein
MKAMQRFPKWVQNIFGKKTEEAPAPPISEKFKTQLDEFIEVYSQLIDFPYFAAPFDKQTNIALAVANFKFLMGDEMGTAFSSAHNIPVDLDAVEDDEDDIAEPTPTKLSYERFGWAEGEAEEHPAMLELAKKRAREGWVAPLMATGTDEFYTVEDQAARIVAKSKKPAKKPASTKPKKPVKKKTKKAAKTHKKGKASK